MQVWSKQNTLEKTILISPCGISVSVPRSCTCYFMSFYPLLGQSIVIYLYVNLFSATLSHPLGYTNHHLSLWITLVWQKRVSCSSGQQLPTWQSFSYSVLVHFYSPQFSSTPRWGLLQLPAQLQLFLHTQVLLCCWKIFSFHFLTCVQKGSSSPSTYPSGTVVSLRGARKASLHEVLHELRKSLSKVIWKLVEEFVQDWYSRLSALWVSPKFVLSFELVQVPALL